MLYEERNHFIDCTSSAARVQIPLPVKATDLTATKIEVYQSKKGLIKTGLS